MRWVTYFPDIHNVHLTKEVGLLPLYMQQVCGWDSKLLGHFAESNYPSLSGEAQGLHREHLPNRGKTAFLERAMLQWLRREGRNTDVLQLAHMARHSMAYGVLYKWYNPGGFLHLKIDAYNPHLAAPAPLAKSALKKKVLGWLQNRFFKQVDLVSIENTEGLSIAAHTWPAISHKLYYMPYGANDRYIDTLLLSEPDQKDKLLLSVTRPGSPEKNCELLLEALPLMALHGWQIVVVGEMSPEFEQKWERVRATLPDQAAQVQFTGRITDRDALYRLYHRASVFFLTSRVESFGIAYAEALYFGCHLIGHAGMYAYSDLTDKGRLGQFFDDNHAASFAESVHRAMAAVKANPGLSAESKLHAKAHFAWTGIATDLKKEIQSRLASRSK